MVWGKPAGSGVDDLVKRLRANDPLLKSLTVLRFRRLNDEDVAQLSRALQDNSVLQELICSSHAISREAAAMLGSMLQLNTRLQHISIGNSNFGDDALAALVCGGLHHNRSLLVWDLEQKGLSHASGASIAQVLQQHPTLRHVQLSRNSLADAGLQQLCAGAWRCLAQLELAACGLTHQGLLSLAAAPSTGQLQQLDLSHNALGPAAAPGLVQLLQRATSLKSLNLNSTQLQDEGVKGLADGLFKATEGLGLLNLSSNQLSSEGVAALAAALRQHPADAAMRQLVLADNPAVGDEALCKLAESLKAPAVLVGSTGAAALDQQRQEDTQPKGGPPVSAAQQQQQQWEQQPQLLLDLAHAGVGAASIAALSKIPGLTQLNLFGCTLGGESGSAVTALIDSISGGGFAALQELSLTGCNLNLQQLGTLMRAVATGSCNLPQLQTLELGANSGVREEGFEEFVAQLRAARPGLDVHWRVADSDSAPAGAGQV